MIIPTEPFGSIPRPLHLIEAVVTAGDYADPGLDDTSTSRDTAFAKIRARVLGTQLAAETIGGR